MLMVDDLSLWWKSIKIMHGPGFDSIVPIINPTVQEDVRSARAIKNVRKAFNAQQDIMHARSLKSHDILCQDNFTCTKSTCFIREPDKIVSEPYEVPPRLYKGSKIEKQNV